jgi:HEAT repeat protein
MHEMSGNREWLLRREADARGTKLRKAISRTEQEPVLRELRARGVSVQSLSALAKLPDAQYQQALPVLLVWVRAGGSPSLRASIARVLATPRAGPTAAPTLISALRVEPDPVVQWSLATAIATLADVSLLDEIEVLVQEAALGKARELLVVALGTVKSPRAVKLLLALIDDPAVGGHALLALRRAGAKVPSARVEQFTQDSRGWVRNEARRLIGRTNPVARLDR